MILIVISVFNELLAERKMISKLLGVLVSILLKLWILLHIVEVGLPVHHELLFLVVSLFAYIIIVVLFHFIIIIVVRMLALRVTSVEHLPLVRAALVVLFSVILLFEYTACLYIRVVLCVIVLIISVSVIFLLVVHS